MKYIVNGGKRLFGSLPVYGSKNCALAFLAASVLTDEDVVIVNCPKIVDVEVMCKILSAMGKKIIVQGSVLCVSGRVSTFVVPPDLCGKLRGSSILLGGLIARYQKARLSLPGGCAIGSRPMDIHLAGLRKMGITCATDNGKLDCFGSPKGTNFELRFASVGATENLLMAAVMANGSIVLTNCATEPEVEALEVALCKMGANINGIGTGSLSVCGVPNLHGAILEVIPDRIVAATYLSAAAAVGGELRVQGCVPSHLTSFVDLLKERFDVTVGRNEIKIVADRSPSDYGEIRTAPYPMFPTDMQSLVLTLAACSDGGETQITENLFENRLQHNAVELGKMGADISVCGNKAVVLGKKLYGANVCAGDLRGGAALVVAGLAASGQTIIDCAEHVARGYYNFAECLHSVGADVICVD